VKPKYGKNTEILELHAISQTITITWISDTGCSCILLICLVQLLY